MEPLESTSLIVLGCGLALYDFAGPNADLVFTFYDPFYSVLATQRGMYEDAFLWPVQASGRLDRSDSSDPRYLFC